MSGRRDVLVVSSVSCIYGIGNPDDFTSEAVIQVQRGQKLVRNAFLRSLVDSLYTRNEIELIRGNRVKGDTVDISGIFRLYFTDCLFGGDEIDEIMTVEPVNYHVIENYEQYNIYPASIFVTTKARINNAIQMIESDLAVQVDFFRSVGKD